MSFLSLLALAFGLAMDATAVAASKGLAARELRPVDVLKVGLLFGGFQALMPLCGYMLGKNVGAYVASWDHWLAFALLAGLGGKMLWEAWRESRLPEAQLEPDLLAEPFATVDLLVLAVATSIDAFAVGVTLPMLGAPLALSLLTIGAVTALSSALGVWAGRRSGHALGPRLDVIGGLVLVLLGMSILVQHLTAE